MSTRLLLIPAHLLLLLINCQCRQIHLTVLRSADGDEGVTVSYWQANATLRVDHTKANRRAPSNLIQNAPVRTSPATALASFVICPRLMCSCQRHTALKTPPQCVCPRVDNTHPALRNHTRRRSLLKCDAPRSRFHRNALVTDIHDNS